MKSKHLMVSFLLMILSVSVTGWACVSNHVNLLKDGTLRLERLPSKGYYISCVHVYQNEDELVVNGNVKCGGYSGAGTGHVDIAIVSPEGEILEQISTRYKPQIISTRRIHNRKSYFEACLSTIPPKGSKIRVAHHRPSKSASTDFSCGKNIAASDVMN